MSGGAAATAGAGGMNGASPRSPLGLKPLAASSASPAAVIGGGGDTGGSASRAASSVAANGGSSASGAGSSHSTPQRPHALEPFPADAAILSLAGPVIGGGERHEAAGTSASVVMRPLENSPARPVVVSAPIAGGGGVAGSSGRHLVHPSAAVGFAPGTTGGQ